MGQFFGQNIENKSQIDYNPLIELEQKKERPVADAGVEFEYMAKELLEEIPNFKSVVLSSEFDDKDENTKEKHIDLIVVFPDNGKLALEVSSTENKEKEIKKMETIIKNPMITEIHNDSGKTILEEKIPRAVIGFKKDIWARALNEAKKKGLTHKIDAFPDKLGQKIELLKRIVESMKLARKYRQDEPEIFNNRIIFLEKSLDTLQQEKERVYH